MSKTVALVGSIHNSKLLGYLEALVSDFLNEEYKYANVNDLDIFILKPIEEKIGADEINEYINRVATTGFNQEKQVFIIESFELVSQQNQNKLLKTIEDNRNNVLQVFITKQENLLLPTIRSRIIEILFKEKEPLNFNDLETTLLYSEVILSNEELVFLRQEPEVARMLSKIYDYCKERDYKRAYLLFSTQVKEVSNNVENIMIRMILMSVSQQGEYALAKTLVEYEVRASYNINKKLLIETMFVEIHKELIWKKL